MNPFQENENIISISSSFYKKYYNDNNSRHLILGINPGRFGAGLTGIPFTDPKRLKTNCNIKFNGALAHELSSVFVYDVINEFGGEIEFGIKTDVCFCFGIGKNEKFLQSNNMNNNTSSIVSKVWSFCNPLRDVGVGYGDYFFELSYKL